MRRETIPRLFAQALVAASVLDAAAATRAAAERAVSITLSKRECNASVRHEVRSPFQSGATIIRVLAPARLEPGRRYPAPSAIGPS